MKFAYSQTDQFDLSKIKIVYVNLDSGEANPIKTQKTKYFDGTIKKNSPLIIYPNIEFQTLEGIGGAFNENGGEAISYLNAEQINGLFKNLFSAQHAGFSFCRTAIGASDFGLDAYSYSNENDDFGMSHFSINRDKKYVIPYIKNALKFNPNLFVFGSPWSPPAWMKQNNSMVETEAGAKVNTLKKIPKIYDAYSKYLAKYVLAYKENGINIKRITIQNEVDMSTKYPSCLMPPAEMVNFATAYLIPQFKKDNLNTELFGGTFRSAAQLDMYDFLSTKGADQLGGVGVQYSSSQYIQETQIKYPKVKIFHTEGNCNGGANSSTEARKRFGEVASYINSGCTAYTYWNMILNETGESGWGWKQNSLINIDRKTKSIQYNPDYNAIYLMSAIIKPGDVRIASMHKGGMISVKDKTGTIKIIVQNDEGVEKGYEIKDGAQSTKITVPANSLIAIIIGK
ncbi:glycosyl hydrolase, 30 family [Arcticibacter svalbardensis MN12-7]|uniref:Glycosyl hydrolase, 30 family n=1 Tax=Arcticibacter svalbardensis MN12-7 TaxID=1150600 RepID=R9GSB2_9SPHI|nr:glycosyl hydrolase, 30 family [Arcticibacter svalbardensis MN12-7]